jgi:hypothetical protein
MGLPLQVFDISKPTVYTGVPLTFAGFFRIKVLECCAPETIFFYGF